jgi:3-methyladenine DNA glycosylase AlkD
MTLAEVLAQLEQMGTETNRRIYRNHGASEPLYGVSTPNLKTLLKAIKKDHALAQQLWETGNYDAQILAAMIADPSQMTSESIDAWARSLNSYAVGDYLADVIIKTPFAEEKAHAWKDNEGDWIGRMGWHLIAKRAADKTLPDSEFEAYLPIIEREIHTRLNRTRQAMLNTLIAIGGRGGAIMDKAIESATRIGPVNIDHGKTGCETPEAIPYMRKAAAHAQKKAAKTPLPAS